MSDHSAIEWTDATWSPVTGCTRVSPGCAHCYIERTPPFRMEGRRFERVGDEETTGVRLHPDRLDQPLRWRKPRRVFVCSLADLFHEEVPDEYIWRVWMTMAEAERHTFQVLTKRPERARDLLRRWNLMCWALPNVWLGVSIENARYTWRADVLREIPAAVTFVSAEPLLGSLMRVGLQTPACDRCSQGVMDSTNSHLLGVCGCACHDRRPLDLSGIDWLIVGGESGPGASPMRPEWARELRDACLAPCPLCAAGDVCATCPVDARRPAFFFKQVGGPTPKSGGRLLDGRTWDEMPLALQEAAS